MTPWNSLATTYVKGYMRRRLVWDTFSHDETDSWGNTETTSSTLAWTTSGGAASDFDIASGVGTISNGSVNVNRFAVAGSGFGDVEVTLSVTVPVVAAGDPINLYALTRVVDTSNYYSFRAVFATDGTVDLIMGRVIAGSGTSLGTASDIATYAAGTTLKMRFQAYSTNLGTSLKGRAWLSTEDEPDEWDIDNVTDNTNELLLGGVGMRASLSVANSNTLPVVLSIDDFTAYSAPDWVDITSEIIVPGIQASTGRQTELLTIEPSRLSFQIRNQSGWFTPDNVVSPYFPDWGTGVPIRWSETIGARSFAFPDMFLEIPEVSLSFEAAGDPSHSDRLLSVNCVDLLTKLQRAPRFVSSLAAYIVGEATEGALRAYYPLTEGSGSTYASSAGPVNQDPLRFTTVASYTPVRFDETLLAFGSEGPPGDDGTSLGYTPDATGNAWGRMANSAVNDSTPDSDSFATLAVWVYVPPAKQTLDQIALVRDLDTFDIAILIDPLGGDEWFITFGTETGADTTLVGDGIEYGRWHFIAGQLDFSGGAIALWLNDEAEVTGTCGGGGTAGKSLNRLVIDGSESSGTGVRLAHLQLYIGDENAFTREDFLAQYDRGINGYPIQRVDERIRTVCNYAGFPDSQLDLEESDSLIQDPAFAGQRPGDLAAAAAVTGGGILFTAGDRLVYHDRKHRFNL